MSNICINSRYHPYRSILSRPQDISPGHPETRLNENVTEVVPDSIKKNGASRQGLTAEANTNEITLIDNYLASIIYPNKEECDIAKKILYKMEKNGFLKKIELSISFIKKKKHNKFLIDEFKDYLREAENKDIQDIIIYFFGKIIKLTAGEVREKLLKYEFGNGVGIKRKLNRVYPTQENSLIEKLERLR